jgi:hypothetical protein
MGARTKSRTDRVVRSQRASTLHSRTAFNIGSFDRNATLEVPDDESSQNPVTPEISLFISKACKH